MISFRRKLRTKSSIYSSMTLLLLVALSYLGCSADSSPSDPSPAKSSPESEDEVSFEVFPSTLELDAQALGALTENAKDGTLRFAGKPAQLESVKKGSVLLGGRSDKTPVGLLRYVVEAKTEGEALVLRTVNVPPQVAFKKMHLKAKRTVADLGAVSFIPNPGVRPLDTGGGTLKKDLTMILFDGDGNESTVDDQVKVTGELGGGLEWFFGWDFAWEETLTDLPSAVSDCLLSLSNFLVGEKPDCSLKALLPEINVGYKVDASGKAAMELSGVAYKGFERKFDIGSTNIGVLWLGPIPVSVDLTIVGVIQGKASSRFSLRTEADFKAGSEVSFSTKNGLSKPSFTPPTVSYVPAQADVILGASAKASVGPEISAKVFGFAGPTASLTAFAGIEADYQASPCFRATAGVELGYGFELGAEIPTLGAVELAKFSDTIPLASKEIGTGSCDVPEGANKLPPGSGADAQTFQSPTFTPWALTYEGEGLVQTIPYTQESLQWLDLDQSIDGRFVLAGSGLASLVKLDPDGSFRWAKRYVSKSLEDGFIRPTRIIDGRDGNMFVLGYPFALLKVGQAGGLFWAKRFSDIPIAFDFPHDGRKEEENAFVAGLPDGAGGLFTVASHQVPGLSPIVTECWIAHLDPEGQVLWSKVLRAQSNRLYPTTMAPVSNNPSDGFILSGLQWNGTVEQRRRAFVARIHSDGKLAWVREWRAKCQDKEDEIQPITSTRTSADNVLVAGTMGSYYRSFTAIVKPDGTITSQSNPWSGEGLSYLTITGLRELPTSGFLAVGTYTYQYDPPSLFLAGLDSAGALQWIHQYLLDSTKLGLKSSRAAIRPTDDGGVLLVTYTTPMQGSSGLWAIKPFAKDGTIAFNTASSAKMLTYPAATGDCIIVDKDLSFEESTLKTTPTPLPLDVVSLPLQSQRQAP